MCEIQGYGLNPDQLETLEKDGRQWWAEYNWTTAQEDEFRKKAIVLVMRDMDVTRKQAEMSVDYFIGKYGFMLNDINNDLQ